MGLRGIGIGEKVSAPVCVINEQRCFTHKAEQLRTTCVGKKWPSHSAFDSVVENDDIGEFSPDAGPPNEHPDDMVWW
jgi:hypothetical protein